MNGSDEHSSRKSKVWNSPLPDRGAMGHVVTRGDYEVLMLKYDELNKMYEDLTKALDCMEAYIDCTDQWASFNLFREILLATTGKPGADNSSRLFININSCMLIHGGQQVEQAWTFQ